MPIMKRAKSKATKLAYEILGTPPSLRKKKKTVNKVDKRLYLDETSRVR